MNSSVVVVGGSGRVGRLMVKKLLARGEKVRVVGRSTQRAQRHLPPGAVFHQGDVRTAHSLGAALAGASAVIYCVEPGTDESGPDRPETTLHIGVQHVIDAATAGGEHPHMVLVSQIHATHHGHPINAYGRVLDWRLAGEEAVRESGLPYTVVRPGWLNDGPGVGARVRLEQGDHGDGQVRRQDLAEACVQALYCPSASGVTFELFNEQGPAPTSWAELYAALEWDPAPVG